MPSKDEQPPAQTLKQAKTAYKRKHGPGLTSREQRQLQRAVELERRAERIRAQDQRRKAAAKLKQEREAKEREERRKGNIAFGQQSLATQTVGWSLSQKEMRRGMESWVGLKVGQQREKERKDENGTKEAEMKTLVNTDKEMPFEEKDASLEDEAIEQALLAAAASLSSKPANSTQSINQAQFSAGISQQGAHAMIQRMYSDSDGSPNVAGNYTSHTRPKDVPSNSRPRSAPGNLSEKTVLLKEPLPRQDRRRRPIRSLGTDFVRASSHASVTPSVIEPAGFNPERSTIDCWDDFLASGTQIAREISSSPPKKKARINSGSFNTAIPPLSTQDLSFSLEDLEDLKTTPEHPIRTVSKNEMRPPLPPTRSRAQLRPLNASLSSKLLQSMGDGELNVPRKVVCQAPNPIEKSKSRALQSHKPPSQITVSCASQRQNRKPDQKAVSDNSNPIKPQSSLSVELGFGTQELSSFVEEEVSFSSPEDCG
jgi:hypothetical protein